MDRKYIMAWQVANFSADFIKFHKILAGDASNIVNTGCTGDTGDTGDTQTSRTSKTNQSFQMMICF
jgi:hypothetical protein